MITNAHIWVHGGSQVIWCMMFALHCRDAWSMNLICCTILSTLIWLHVMNIRWNSITHPSGRTLSYLVHMFKTQWSKLCYSYSFRKSYSIYIKGYIRMTNFSAFLLVWHLYFQDMVVNFYEIIIIVLPDLTDWAIRHNLNLNLKMRKKNRSLWS